MRKVKFIYVLVLAIVTFMLPLAVHAQSNAVNESLAKIQDSKLLNQPYNTVLYKAGVEAYGRYFSGIYLFKQMPDTSFRIVMLSEFGLNFFDFSYKNKEFKVENCQEFLNKPILLKMMQKDLRLLLSEIDHPVKVKSITKKGHDGQVIKFKNNSDKYYYFYNLNGKLEKVVIKESLFSKANILIDSYEGDIPKKISIDRNRQKLKISLTLLKIEE